MATVSYAGIFDEYQRAAGDNDIFAAAGLIAAAGTGAHITTLIANHITGWLHDMNVLPDPSTSDTRAKVVLAVVMGLIVYALAVMRAETGGVVNLAIGGMGLGALLVTAMAALSAILSLNDSSDAAAQVESLMPSGQPELPSVPMPPGRDRYRHDAPRADTDRYRGHSGEKPDDYWSQTRRAVADEHYR